MSRLYIANPTPQNQQVHYRLDYSRDGELNANSKFQPARQQDIRAGQQVQLGGDFHGVQIKEIIDQLGAYGLVMVEDVPRLGRTKATYIGSIDKPIPGDIMRRVQFHNSAILVTSGQELRKKASVAVDAMVQQTVATQLAEAGIQAEPAEQTIIGFEQQDQSEAGEKRIEEGYIVQPGKDGGKNKGKRK